MEEMLTGKMKERC